MNLSSIFALALLAPIGFGLALTLDLRVEPDENNIASERLAGRWEMDAELCKRLGVKHGDTRIEFAVDDSFLPLLPNKYDEFFSKKPIFEAGRVTWTEGGTPRSYPYLLTEHAGNPHLFTFRERNGETMGDAESCMLSVIPAKEHGQDLLFLGGDFDNEAFRPFRRTKTETDEK